MRSRTVVIAALLCLFMIALPAIPAVEAQGDPANAFCLETNMTISGVLALEGKGTATITFTGATASPFRNDVLMVVPDDGQGVLSSNEIRIFLTTVSSFLLGKSYWGITIDSVEDFASASDAQILAHTSGLVDTDRNTKDVDASFSFGFSGSGEATSKMIPVAQGAADAFAVALRQAMPEFEYNGTFIVKQRVSTLGVASYTGPALTEGTLKAVRHPFGAVTWYTYVGPLESGTTANDTIAFESFSILENQQIAFVVLLVGGLMIARMPTKFFDKFEKLHPRKFRKYAKPLLSVKLFAIALIVVLAVLYLLPYLLSPRAPIYSAFLYLLVPIAVVGQHFLSKKMYDKAAIDIPDESIIEVKQAMIQPEEGEGEMYCKVCYRPIEAGLELFQCSCGARMHMDCAEKAQTCPACSQPLFPERTRSIECRACGETFLYSGSEDPYSIQCTKCGAFQEDVKPGKNYLVVDAEPENAFMMLRAMGLSERPTLIMTTQFPGKIRSDYDLVDVQIKCFSDASTDIDNIDPKNLEADAMEVVSTFLMTTRNAGVLVDGIETLSEMNGFDKVMAFVKKLNDLARTHGSTIILSANKKLLTESQFKALSEAFDEVHDFQ
jgi:hypothetical protein